MTIQKEKEQMSWWHARVSFETAQPFVADDFAALIDALADHGASGSVSRSFREGGVVLTVEASTPLEATTSALNIITNALNSILGALTITGLDVMSEEALDAELATPVFPDVVGYAEIAELAGVSRQRARQFAQIEGFPVPVIETAQGPLMSKHAVERWLETRSKSSGRPRKLLQAL
ncbi:hypothetical protein [Microterricola viridarii]|uniref:DNA-binding protein n=1 Tax=Microterricola viridarii TaxID=412690 RepID=A0A1H1YNJ6_9MICO|nr:hypothetical protein [Microterricola viridarii]SDT22809.1 hypothetical protein SAMN04489834_3144 [Microterricola viridarii]